MRDIPVFEGRPQPSSTALPSTAESIQKTAILPLISSKIGKQTTIFTDGFKTYDGPVDLGYKKHCRVHHGKNKFSRKEEDGIKNHINGIESF